MNALGELFTDIATAIREKTGSTETMKPIEFPEKIAAIETGGGSSPDVRYVTFMSQDGTIEYGKKAVAVGDDCADPIKRGLFDTPTKESTAKYDYDFSGWGKYKNSAAYANALSNVTQDITVYAAFSSSIRYYTVTFYDGETVMKTERVAYGSTATPPDTTKEHFVFSNWIPEDLTIVCDTDFIGVWNEGAVRTIIPYQEITSSYNESYKCNCVYIPFEEEFSFVEGETYFVEFNGVAHELVGLKVLGKHTTDKPSETSYTSFQGVGNPYVWDYYGAWYYPNASSESNKQYESTYGGLQFAIQSQEYFERFAVYTDEVNTSKTYTLKVYQRL